MNKLLLFLLTLAPCIAFGQLTYVPDDNFEAYIEFYHGGNGIANDNYVTTSNISSITNLNVTNINISDLTGIEDFSDLTQLFCQDNQLTFLDVSNNMDLSYLYCGDNQLTSLDVSNNTALIHLHCGDNQLTNLNVSGTPSFPPFQFTSSFN